MNADLIESLAHVADSSENVPHLRRLVVALAISGKLNASDDEASFTLMRERLKAERVRLIKTGKLKRQEELPSVSYEELPFEISNACHFERLGNLATLAKGLTGIQSATHGPFPLVVTAEARSSCDHFDFDGTAAIVPMVSSAGHGKASINRLHYQEGKFALGNILCAVFPISEEILSARFLYEYLAAFKEDLLVTRMIGTANVSLTIGKIAEVPVPLVSRRIQQRVDELMALCDRLEAAQTERESWRDRLVASSLNRLNNGADPDAFYDHARVYFNHLPSLTTRFEHIQQLRQTILNLAVRGKLVPQAADDEPASELLKRIQAEKARLATVGRIKKDKIARVGLPEEPPHKLPLNWEWTRLQDMFEISRGGSPRPAGDPRYFGGAIPWITVREITKDGEKYLTSTEGGLTEEGATRSRFIDPGDLLLTNSGATLGVPKISRIRACMNDGVAVLRLFHSVPLNDFAYLYLHSQTPMFRQVNQGMGQPNLNTQIIAGWFFPLPPLAEQHRIVAKVEELTALCDRLEAQLTTTQTESRRLLEAVLHEALAGQGELEQCVLR